MSMMPTSVVSLARFTPSETTRSASTSRPESVSSRTAKRGLKSSIWRISWRFFSPPEKPSLPERSAKELSMRRFSIAPLTSLPQVRSAGASPEMAVLAVRRKFATDTPGTSTGYCIARNRPARARSSTLMARTSSPSSVTVPDVTSYLGWPARAEARVDLPEPFGPMMACVSPDLMVRSTPRRIGFGPSLVSTLTCRSRISRVDISGSPNDSKVSGREKWGSGRNGDRGVDVDEDLVAFHGDRIDGHRPGRGQLQRLAGAQVELRAVQPALDPAALDLAVRQRHRSVRADVADRVEVAVGVPDECDGDGGPVRVV